ncbi:MAG: DUF5009 domain-containing protein [Muribaculaceae bacterium]|nr:DUF5009 domain-containing protein [Muribaculaceae bacterium]
MKPTNRLMALDIMRGITIAGMLLVNNPGTWGAIYPPLEHAEWNGLTPTDLVFPFFMFIMGISTCMSLRRYDYKWSMPLAFKVIRRTVVIFFIGLFIAWLSKTLRAINTNETLLEAMFSHFDTLRFLGVMPRLALCYFFTSVLVLSFGRKSAPWIAGIILVGYALLLILGNGFEFSQDNVLYILDQAIIGPDHLYSDTVGGVTLKFDPEGLLSTLPSIAHCLIGFICGGIILNRKDNLERVTSLFVVGTVLMFSGFLMSYGIPINKKIWTPAFVFTTCGMAASLLALLVYFIDVRGYRKGWGFFNAFGVNPLAMYTLGSVASVFMGAFPLGPYPKVRLKAGVMEFINSLVPDSPELASLIYAMVFVCVIWCVGEFLYRKQIYIKI